MKLTHVVSRFSTRADFHLVLTYGLIFRCTARRKLHPTSPSPYILSHCPTFKCCINMSSVCMLIAEKYPAWRYVFCKWQVWLAGSRSKERRRTEEKNMREKFRLLHKFTVKCESLFAIWIYCFLIIVREIRFFCSVLHGWLSAQDQFFSYDVQNKN